MKPIIPSACVWIGGALVAAASGLFWYIILTPDLPLRSYTIATAVLFAAGVLLIALTPLVVGARATASSGASKSRPQVENSATSGSRAAKILIWLILAIYVAIALLR